MATHFTPAPDESENSGIHCFFCPCGQVCLRWRRALLLHFNQGELACAVDCLRDVLQEPDCGFCLGAGEFSACRAQDGYYYLLCQDHVVLRLSEEEAQTLHSELASARAAFARRNQETASRGHVIN